MRVPGDKFRKEKISFEQLSKIKTWQGFKSGPVFFGGYQGPVTEKPSFCTFTEWWRHQGEVWSTSEGYANRENPNTQLIRQAVNRIDNTEGIDCSYDTFWSRETPKGGPGFILWEWMCDNIPKIFLQLGNHDSSIKKIVLPQSHKGAKKSAEDQWREYGTELHRLAKSVMIANKNPSSISRYGAYTVQLVKLVAFNDSAREELSLFLAREPLQHNQISILTLKDVHDEKGKFGPILIMSFFNALDDKMRLVVAREIGLANLIYAKYYSSMSSLVNNNKEISSEVGDNMDALGKTQYFNLSDAEIKKKSQKSGAKLRDAIRLRYESVVCSDLFAAINRRGFNPVCEYVSEKSDMNRCLFFFMRYVIRVELKDCFQCFINDSQ